MAVEVFLSDSWEIKETLTDLIAYIESIKASGKLDEKAISQEAQGKIQRVKSELKEVVSILRKEKVLPVISH